MPDDVPLHRPTADADRRLLTERMFAFAPVSASPGTNGTGGTGGTDGIDGHDCFQSTTPLWRPLWGRGVYGGALAGQALAIAQETVDAAATGLLVHSMHCHFLRPVRDDTARTPVVYDVDRVRDGRSVAVRVVSARQAGKVVFRATLSFAREEAKGTKALQHQAALPALARKRGPPTQRADEAVAPPAVLSPTCQVDHGSFFEGVRVDEDGDGDDAAAAAATRARPEQARFGQWVRACSEPRSSSSSSDSTPPAVPPCKPHLAALAYLSDHYFIGTVLRAHHAWRFNGANSIATLVRNLDAGTPDGRRRLGAIAALQREEADELARTRRRGRNSNNNNTDDDEEDAVGEMLVSLDHTIYFHQPTAVRADEWMFFEMETPWAGHERGLVVGRIWSQDGLLLATCIQEGLVRLGQRPTGPESKL